MSDESDRDSKSPQSPETRLPGQSTANDRAVEDLARELSERLREMPNRQEMTDYAVSLLKDSNEEADQADLARDSKVKASRGDPFNPIAFAIPLLVVGLVLMATGLLTGMGILVVAIAIVMFAYGLIVPLFSRGGGGGKPPGGES
jgi:Flp pilus assembly protein TadB